MRIFEYSLVPMVIVDDRRRYVEVNLSAQLFFRLSQDELRALAIDDLLPPDLAVETEQRWDRLLDTGVVAGRYHINGHDGRRLDMVYCGLANVLSGLHLYAFAPAEWPGEPPPETEDAAAEALPSLTPREVEVLTLAAEGYSGPELAQKLVLSRATISTHFKNIYEKLEVRNRAAAVAKAMRLGMID